VTQVWECPGPPGAETVVLIHGVTFTAELNWGRVLAPLGQQYRVIALDQRGHGHGIRAASPYRLEDCADDVAALAATLGIERFIAVGYSMGGIIAQLLYRRHPELLSGLVLCSTAGNVRESAHEYLAALALPAIAAAMAWNPMMRLVGAGAIGANLLGAVEDPTTRAWAHGQLRRTSLTTALAAIHAVCEFASTEWIGQVRVPTAVVVTTRDRVVPPSRQRRLAAAIPGAVSFDLDGDHGVCVTAPALFAETLLAACAAVTPVQEPEPEPEERPPRTRPVARYPVPKANSWTWRSLMRRARWRHGWSKPSKSVT
jgi:pimeloyl-ACP methyl ester carboxylesterase